MFYQNLLEHLNRKGGWSMICVDAVVGAGKSTLASLLAKRGFTMFPEPVVDNPALELFYQDRSRYSFALQAFFLTKRFQHVQEAARMEMAVLDRSIYGDAIFAKMLHDSGEMSDAEFDIYQELFKTFISQCRPPKLMVYLDISVEEAMRRIALRGRDFEQTVERGYWERLNREYHDFFGQYQVSPLLKINVDHLDFAKRPQDAEYVVALIENKLGEIDGRLAEAGD